MTGRQRSHRRADPIACGAAAGALLVDERVALVQVVERVERQHHHRTRSETVVSLYAFGLSVLGAADAGIARALRLISKSRAAAAWGLLAFATVLVAYRFFSY